MLANEFRQRPDEGRVGVGIQLSAGAPGTFEAEQQPSVRLADDDQRARAATLGRSSRDHRATLVGIRGHR